MVLKPELVVTNFHQGLIRLVNLIKEQRQKGIGVVEAYTVFDPCNFGYGSIGDSPHARDRTFLAVGLKSSKRDIGLAFDGCQDIATYSVRNYSLDGDVLDGMREYTSLDRDTQAFYISRL